jgi:hypothetical protein
MPPDFGNLPQQITAVSVGGIFLSLAGLLLKWVLGKGQLSIAAQKVAVEAKQVANADAADVRDHFAGEIKELRDELRRCEEDCDRRLGIAEARMRALEEELWGEKRQRVAEQISLINTIVNTVDAPELKALLKSFESVRTHLESGRK